MNVPFMKEALSTGTAKSSFIASLLETLSGRTDAPADEEEVIRNVGAVAYGAGSDTTVAALSTFVLAMVLHPNAQRKAQDELDSIIGMDRFPEFEDRDSLPYVNAICQEVQRWHRVLPLGVAHAVMQEDVYGDYFIPKGSIIIENAWSILHDKKLYGPEPEKFIRERFLIPGVKDPSEAGSFGFGRRICPGRHTAQSSIFMAVASILKVFDISTARDSRGNEIHVNGAAGAGFISHPEPFVCSIILRSMVGRNFFTKYYDE